MTKCANCGHDCHCGVPLKKTFKDPLSTPNEIEVCKQCRCKNCSEISNDG